MNKERLLRLVKLPRGDAANPTGVKFDLSSWGEAASFAEGGTIKVDCGTSACAMGLAAISGEFAAEGLGIKPWINRPGDIGVVMPSGAEGFAAACELFDIDEDEAEVLFDPSYYVKYEQRKGAEGERYVADRIERFANGESLGSLTGNEDDED